MSKIQFIKKGASTYAYELVYYYDKKKKYGTNKKVYLGKVYDGVISRVRKQGDGKASKITFPSEPVSSHSVGVSKVLQQVLSETGLRQCLESSFEDVEIVKSIIYLSIFKATCGDAFYLFSDWLEEAGLDCKYKTSQNISELFSTISESVIATFFTEWQKRLTTEGVIYYDITSLSSSANNIDFVEFGHSKDDQSVPQINLGIFKERTSNLPVFYRYLPGSINDVSTLENIVNITLDLSVNLNLLIMDKGFYSAKNLSYLIKKGLNFIIPITYSNKEALAKIKQHLGTLNDFNSSFNINKNTYHYSEATIEIAGHAIRAVIYRDLKKEADFYNALVARLNDFKEQMAGVSDFKKVSKKASEYRVAKYLIISDTGEYQVKTKLINEYKLKAGTFILLTNNSDLKVKEILQLYRDKDSIEKSYTYWKTDMEERVLRVHNNATLQGKMFVLFISLILISQIRNIIRNSKDKKINTMSLQKMIKELSKIKLVTSKNKVKTLLETTATQNLILKNFGFDTKKLIT